MKTIGLTKDKKVQEYLSKINSINIIDDSDIPVFQRDNIFFSGGFKSFYVLTPKISKDEFTSYVTNTRKKYKNIHFLFSTPYQHGSTKLVNYVLNIKDILREEDFEKRLEMYEGKTRNLVRKSYKNDFSLTISKDTPLDFYKLYKESIDRLGGITKDKKWFEDIKNILENNIITFSLLDKEKLIGVNYCIISDRYIFLMFNVSDPEYWKYSINDRLYDEMIKWSLLNDIDFIDFGPSISADDSHNHFKAGFGAKKWYIFNNTYGTITHRIYAFLKQKIHNLKLRLNKLK